MFAMHVRKPQFIAYQYLLYLNNRSDPWHCILICGAKITQNNNKVPIVRAVILWINNYASRWQHITAGWGIQRWRVCMECNRQCKCYKLRYNWSISIDMFNKAINRRTPMWANTSWIFNTLRLSNCSEVIQQVLQARQVSQLYRVLIEYW